MKARADRTSVALGALGVLAFVTAAALFLAALSVDATSEHLAETDARFVEDATTLRLWSAPPTWRASLARDVLAVEDDFSFREGVRLYRRASLLAPRSPGELATVRTRRSVAASALERHDLGDDESPRRSQTANLLGVLAMANADDGRVVQQPHFDRALRQFRRAIVFDPRNEAAKRNLERLLRRAVPQGARVGERPTTGRKGRAQLPRPVAGLSPSGEGY